MEHLPGECTRFALKIHCASFQRGEELRGPETIAENPLCVFSARGELRGPETIAENPLRVFSARGELRGPEILADFRAAR